MMLTCYKYCYVLLDIVCFDLTSVDPLPKRSASDDLMERAREQAARGKASRYIPERKPPNGKTPNMDKLYNSLVPLLEVQLVSFPSIAAGEKFTKALTDTLFYIDGHQRTINERFPIPSIVLQYQELQKYVDDYISSAIHHLHSIPQ